MTVGIRGEGRGGVTVGSVAVAIRLAAEGETVRERRRPGKMVSSPWLVAGATTSFRLRWEGWRAVVDSGRVARQQSDGVVEEAVGVGSCPGKNMEGGSSHWVSLFLRKG